ncbi:MAG TPA: hypothetical protein DG414_09115 [Gammaproteobacteria bacterium]|nr:MBL fold metallo-hydrolase [Arenicellales bacterium]MDP6948432.1 MBL fold metallo-hydrolase [Arenicellales bacterium]HCY13982.1 hypothetical protein [Gammaproteobacteria bacterium]
MRKSWLIFFLSVFLLAGCSRKPDASWHMVNVNTGELQGDANLIQTGESVIMIDGGYYNEAKKSLLPYLAELGIDKIDHFFVSHPHRDHYEGLVALLEAGVTVSNLHLRIPPQHICDREIPWGCDMADIAALVNKAEAHGVIIHHPEAGLRYDFGLGSAIEILHAQEDDLPADTIDVNDLSLIMQWSINDVTVLFTGDLNMKVGTVLSDDPRMNSDFMKMPHHGSTGLAPNAFFEQVDPGYVLVPGPQWIWCGDRGARPREWVKQKKLPVWVNGIDGHVRVDFFRDRIVVTPEHDSAECKLRAFGKMEISL